MRVPGSPRRSSESSSIAIARSTDSSLKYTTSASPEKVPSSRAYSFTFGYPPSSSSISPNFPKHAQSSSESASTGRPVMYTAVFFDLRSGWAGALEDEDMPLLLVAEEGEPFLPRLPDGPAGQSEGSLRFLLRRFWTGAAGAWRDKVGR